MPDPILENVIPILNVTDLGASLDHYEKVLGFEIEWQTDAMAGIKRDGFAIYLSQEDQSPLGTRVWVGVHDLDRLKDEYDSSGARIVMPPTNFPWAREMRVEDLDGNVFRFGGGPTDAE